MSTRIDATRRDINDTIALLRYLSDQLEDLHVLAYNRHRAAQEAKVRGGSRDYALDTHGDPRARDLLHDTTGALDRVLGDTSDHIKAVRSYLTKGTGSGKRDATADATADEVIAALDARRRRKARAEYHPAPLADQPQVWSQTEWQVECEHLRSAVRKVTDAFLDDHQTCLSSTVDHRGQRPKLLRRFPLKLLIPRERESWNRATQSVSENDSQKAS